MVIEGIEHMTTRALGLALDASVLRQQAIASNIANANTEGYRPVTVDFEGQLEQARANLEAQGFLRAGSLEGVEPRIVMRPSSALFGLPAKVQLDLEVSNMTQNAVHFQAMARGLSRHFSILSAAVSDGKK